MPKLKRSFILFQRNKDISFMLKAQRRLLKYFKKNPEKIGSWNRIHLSDKNQIRKAGVPVKFAELRITSGSTGKPLYIFYSKEAVDSFIKRAVISLKKSRLSNKDIVLNLFAYGNYVPGSMYEKACQKERISVIPLGAPNSYPKEKILEAIAKIKPNVWLSVPSYAITLLDLLAEDRRPQDFPKKIIVAGEKLLETYIKKFEGYDVEVINHFGLTECPAIGVSKKNNLNTLEIINDGIYTESFLDKDNTRHLVVTDLNNFATPIIRYRTGDIINNVKHNSDGSLAEISIIGRSDDLIKIQGVLVSKTRIIKILSNHTHKFFVDIKTKKGRDFVEIILDQKHKKFKKKIDEELKFLKKRKLVFRKHISVPKTISYKNNYIVDSRR